MERDGGQDEGGFENEIAVARYVKAIGGDAVEAEALGDVVTVDGKAAAGEGGDAEAGDIGAAAAIGQTLPIALEFFTVGQPVMRSEHWLGALQVSVARQDDVEISIAAADEGPLQGKQPGIDRIERV